LKCGARKFAHFKSGRYACRRCGDQKTVGAEAAALNLSLAVVYLFACIAIVVMALFGNWRF
jgi:hypothetical protein